MCSSFKETLKEEKIHLKTFSKPQNDNLVLFKQMMEKKLQAYILMIS